MWGLHKFNFKTFLFATAILLLFSVTQSVRANNHFQSVPRIVNDTVPKKKLLRPGNVNPVRQQPVTPNIAPQLPANNNNSVSPNIDTTRLPTDSLRPRNDTFSLRYSKDTLDAPVNYEAEDSVVVLVPEKKIIMYGKTKTIYQDVTLTAPKVELDQASNIVTAFNEKDSTGYVVTRARFEQGENKFESDEISFNFKTQKGFTKNTFTQQQDLFVQGETIKKINSNTLFIKQGKFTTCNLDEPHFDFFAKRMKVVNNKVAVTGFVQLEFEGVPLPKPIGLPFGLFPLSKGRHSGLLPPQFTVNEQFGLGLEGLGYYQVLNDNFDATIRGNLYSYGGWSINFSPTYRRRYKYNGALNLGLINSKINFKGDPDYSKTQAFNISWNHAQDPKARPGRTFSANVNAGSSQYNRAIPNDPRLNFQNQLNSSISYSKTWPGKPYNLTVSANHDQNNATRLINLRLPDAGFTVTSINPFKRKERVGSEKWFEKIGVGYSGSFRNQISFYDSAVTFSKLLDTLQLGANHQVPITLSLPPMGAFIVSPNISYQEQWIQRKIDLEWNEAKGKVDTSFSKGFYTARQMSMGLGFNTALYGTVQFKNSRVIAIRHTVRPQFGISYSPNMAKKYYDVVQRDTTGKNFITYNQYSNNISGGGFSNRKFGGINFGIDNSVEMKVRSKDDTSANANKKVRLIDGLSINSGYNFLEDSFQLLPFNMSFRSTLFDKVNLSASAYLDPYQVNDFGNRINRLSWIGNKFSVGRVTNASLSLSTSFKSKPRDATKAVKDQVLPISNSQIGVDPTLMADQQRLQDYMRRNPSEFVDFNIPWDIGFDVSMSLTRVLKPDLSGFNNLVTATTSFRSSFSLTPKWNFSTNGYFDFRSKKIETFTMSINRELHCWQMSINVTPVGLYSYFNISISPKSSILQDLRVNRTRSFSDF
jgi:hypothetical protein